MVLTPVERNGVKILLAEGRVDAGLSDRLEAALAAHPGIAEIWLSSPGGDARAGNEAGRIIRRNLGLTSRIPSGSACFSACNFVFMGGIPRYVDPGGLFIVHMFTRTGDRSTIDMSVAMGTDATTALIGDVEQDAALLASAANAFPTRMGRSRQLLNGDLYRPTGGKGRGPEQCQR